MFNEMEKTVKKLLTIIKKNYNGYPNEKLIIKFLSNIYIFNRRYRIIWRKKNKGNKI